jgi:hypothetical protein
VKSVRLCMRFEVLMAAKMSVVVFWIVTLYGLVSGYQQWWRQYVPPKL